jgi:hypothetical protein
VLYIDVAKVDRDVVHVVMAISGRLCPQRSGASKSVVKISYLRCET